MNTGTVSRAVTRPILPSADPWAARPVPEPAALRPVTARGHLVEFQLLDLHGNLVRVGCPS